MSLTLHRFPLSHFAEKGRALLDFKGLDYTIVDHTLGLPQLEIKRISGQRKVPVLVHEGRVVSDSTRIAHYLDETFPDRRRLIPLDEPRRSEVLALEEKIDRVFGIGPTLMWAEHALAHRDHLDLIAMEIHGANVPIVRATGVLARLGHRFGLGRAFIERKRTRTMELLRECVARLDKTAFLVGDEPTLADVAAAGLVFHLEFPRSKYFAVPSFQGRGVDAVTGEPSVRRFFEWRREFYATQLR